MCRLRSRLRRVALALAHHATHAEADENERGSANEERHAGAGGVDLRVATVAGDAAVTGEAIRYDAAAALDEAFPRLADEVILMICPRLAPGL